ncbi:hypothetical protein [Microbacterium thalassium]|uniref:Uncharacterized protein n=1 Tax=Microbacterium thalassium TaxID=362649 RepID=A0A7X0FSM9_9MICO|nr:hypothetical protein [Microbacterium thalassium]MBB6392964.1 hypothetical protein [Microbacterium thalassium]
MNGAVVVGLGALVAGGLTGCADVSRICYPIPSEVMDDIASRAPGLEPIVGSGVASPRSDNFIYIAMRFSVDGRVDEGVWGDYYGEVIAIDDVARDVSDWPQQLDDGLARDDARSIDDARHCLAQS